MFVCVTIVNRNVIATSLVKITDVTATMHLHNWSFWLHLDVNSLQSRDLFNFYIFETFAT